MKTPHDPAFTKGDALNLRWCALRCRGRGLLRALLTTALVAIAVGSMGCAIGPKQDDPASATSLPPKENDAALLQDDGIRGGSGDASVTYADGANADSISTAPDVAAEVWADGATDATSFDGDGAASDALEVASDGSLDER